MPVITRRDLLVSGIALSASSLLALCLAKTPRGSILLCFL